MKQITINGTPRVTGKKADVKSVRKGQRVPCVLYGQGIENVSFSVDEKDLSVITDTPYSHIINVNIEGKEQLAVIHEVQYNPVTDKAIHADFLAISSDKPVVIDVPIKVTGNAEGVKIGGKLSVSARKLRISGTIDKLPDDITIDVTSLQIGKQISAGDLKYDDFKIVSPKHMIICAVRMTRAVADTTDTTDATATATAATTAAPQQ